MSSTLQDIDLTELVTRDIADPIPDDLVQKALSTPPFVHVPGTFNLRDIGLSAKPHIKPGRFYRSGTLAHLTEDGKQELLSKLDVGIIIDLRSEGETKRHPPPHIPGVKIVWLPTEKIPIPPNLDRFVGHNGGENGYTEMYLEYLETYAPSFRHVLEYLRDDGQKGVLFHCTAGKDRTGVLASIILSLAGAPDAAIAADYALTRIGIEPQREFLLQFLMKANPQWTEDTPGAQEFFAIRETYMLAFLDAVRKQYGGMEEYAKSRLGFSEEDVIKIKNRLKDV